MKSAFFVLAVALVGGCKKTKTAAPGEPANTGSAAPEPVKPAAGTGLAVTDNLNPEYNGAYDKVFAQLRHDEHRTVIAFVRGCPQLTCDPGPWETEQVAHACAKAMIATFAVDGEDAGKFHADLKIAGPADAPSTVTIEHVSLELTAVGNDGVAGTAHSETTDATVDGSFHAEVCPRT